MIGSIKVRDAQVGLRISPGKPKSSAHLGVRELHLQSRHEVQSKQAVLQSLYHSTPQQLTGKAEKHEYKDSNEQVSRHACRFVTLVDVLYENRIRLFCSAEDDPMQLFQHIVTVADAHRLNKSNMVCPSDFTP